MSTSDPTTTEVLRAVSTPADASPRGMHRRRFLQAAAVAGGASVLPAWLADAAAAATPIGAGDGVLVVILMAGGNDGLGMVPPMGDAAYASLRKGLAIPASSALKGGAGFGFHPNLKEVKKRWDAGQVAVLQGVGDLEPDLSHFTAMARWMSGDGSSLPTTGWIGRYVDGLAGGDDPFHAVTLGTSVPLAMVGRARRGTALPMKVDAGLSTTHKDDWVRRSAECVRAMGGATNGLGTWGESLATAGRTAIDLTARVSPLYGAAFPEGKLAAQAELAARLINADLGVRALHLQYGDFDHHADAPGSYPQRMAELDAAVARLYATLQARFQKRVTVLTVSEFGRRAQANQSNGTDHGTATTLLAIGPGVKGGAYGQAPSLTKLDRHGNLVPTVDFRSVYASVLQTWLRADPKQVLGASFEDLKFLKAPTVS